MVKTNMRGKEEIRDLIDIHRETIEELEHDIAILKWVLGDAVEESKM